MKILMLAALYAAIAGTANASDQPHSTTYEICKTGAENAGNIRGMRLCMADETARHDAILNAAYQCLQDRLPQDQFKALQQVQRRWISDTGSACALPKGDFEDARASRTLCRFDATSHQAAQLSAQANALGCAVPPVTHVRSDLGKWQVINGWTSISNLNGAIYSIDCNRQTAQLLPQDSGASFEGVSFVKLSVLDRDSDVVNRFVVQATSYEDTASLQTTYTMQTALARGYRVNLRGQDHLGIDLDNAHASFTLHGSRSALDVCGTQSSDQSLLPFSPYRHVGDHSLNVSQQGQWIKDWFLLDLDEEATESSQTKMFASNGNKVMQIQCVGASLGVALKGRIVIDLLNRDLSSFRGYAVYRVGLYLNGANTTLV